MAIRVLTYTQNVRTPTDSTHLWIMGRTLLLDVLEMASGKCKIGYICYDILELVYEPRCVNLGELTFTQMTHLLKVGQPTVKTHFLKVGQRSASETTLPFTFVVGFPRV